MQARCLAVLVAAGDGNRLGRPEGKALVALAGRPLFIYPLEKLLGNPSIEAVAVVVRPQDHDAIADAIDSMLSPGARAGGRVLLVEGGPVRQDSVRNGLEALAAHLAGETAPPPGEEVVLIHDAARPLLSAKLVSSVAAAAVAGDPRAVIAPALAVTDALRVVAADEEGQSTPTGAGDATAKPPVPPREHLRLMQTPQAGFLAGLLDAHRWAAAHGDGGPGWVDDVSLAEAYGMRIRLVPGEQRNLKVTIPEDLALAEGLLKATLLPRTGIGFDIHPLRPREGAVVRLGGVDIPADLELVGHSDADAATHAVIDALLGAVGAGDIGMWFPPGEAEWRGADSMRLLRTVWATLAGQGFVLGNLDLTIQAERPRLSPHYDAMRANIAGALYCRPEDVSVKATTTERLGAIGRGEGIAAMAIATVFAGPAPGAVRDFREGAAGRHVSSGPPGDGALRDGR